MKTRRAILNATRLSLTTILALTATVVNAAEIKVLSSAGVKAVTDELTPQFERTSGHKVAISFDVAAVLKRKIEAGESFDLAILTAPMIDDLIKQGKISAATRTDIARSGVGIAVRAGAAKPDISSAEALKRTLLNAKSIAYSKEGASGVYFASLLERLGIVEELKAKNQLITNPSPIEVVARGEAEIGVRLVSEILVVPGTELLGPLPAELQNFTVLTAGLSDKSKEAEVAKALVTFLTGPAALPVMKAKGLEPGAAH